MSREEADTGQRRPERVTVAAAARAIRAARSTTGGTIVITNKTSSPIIDATPYNHYSLLRSMEEAFRLPCLAHACDSAVTPMTPLFHT